MQSAEHMSCLTAAVHVALGRLCHAVKEACLDPGLESEKNEFVILNTPMNRCEI